VRLLREWLDAAGITEGALFRQVPKGSKRVGDRISGRAYYDIVKQGIAGIGLDASKFGSHSMRSGWISTAARNGASVWKMKEISRHKSTDVFAAYVREAELFQQHAYSPPSLGVEKIRTWWLIALMVMSWSLAIPLTAAASARRSITSKTTFGPFG
jgi:hypothetical protein